MLKKHTLSVKNAWEGVKWAFATQANYRIHFFLSALAFIGSFVFHVTYYEFLFILFAIFIGIMVEAVNTAIELTTDAIDKEWREDIKLAKDVSAAAMLLYSIGAFILACIIFIPKLVVFFTR